MYEKEDAGPLSISRTAFSRFQYGIVTALVILGALHFVFLASSENGLITRLTSIFNVDREDSIPTAFSIINLLIAGMLASMIHRHSKSHREKIAIHWLVLSIVLFAMAIDEAAGIHERANQLQAFTGRLVPVHANYQWIAYGAILAPVVFIFFIPFLVRLERRTAALLLLSGAIFLAGALGFEFINGWLIAGGPVHQRHPVNLTTKLFEEGFEMYAIALFNCALFAYAMRRKITVTVSTKP